MNKQQVFSIRECAAARVHRGALKPQGKWRQEQCGALACVIVCPLQSGALHSLQRCPLGRPDLCYCLSGARSLAPYGLQSLKQQNVTGDDVMMYRCVIKPSPVCIYVCTVCMYVSVCRSVTFTLLANNI